MEAQKVIHYVPQQSGILSEIAYFISDSNMRQ